MRYDQVLAGNRAAYDGSVDERDAMAKPPWKVAERAAFLERLRASRRCTPTYGTCRTGTSTPRTA